MCSCGGQSPVSQRYVDQLSHFTCLLESIQGPLDINHGQVFDQVDNIDIVSTEKSWISNNISVKVSNSSYCN